MRDAGRVPHTLRTPGTPDIPDRRDRGRPVGSTGMAGPAPRRRAQWAQSDRPQDYRSIPTRVGCRVQERAGRWGLTCAHCRTGH